MTKICKNPICGHERGNHHSIGSAGMKKKRYCDGSEDCPCKKFEANHTPIENINTPMKVTDGSKEEKEPDDSANPKGRGHDSRKTETSGSDFDLSEHFYKTNIGLAVHKNYVKTFIKKIEEKGDFYDKISKKRISLKIVRKRIKNGLRNTLFIVLDYEDFLKLCGKELSGR